MQKKKKKRNDFAKNYKKFIQKAQKICKKAKKCEKIA